MADSGHIMYAVELAVFGFVGWGWLATRELLGATPVLDVAVLVSVAVLSCFNLGAALLLYTTDRFEGAARAFLSQALALWALYCHGLLQTTGGGELQCTTGPASAPRTYAAAFFGGLAYHQAPAAFTLAFLTFVVILAAGQVRSCGRPPSHWLSQCTGQAVVLALGLHLAAFLFSAPLPASYVGGGVLLTILLLLEFASMVRVDFVRTAAGAGQEGDGTIQYILEWVLHGLVVLVALSLSGSLSARFPASLFLFSLAVFAGQGLARWWPEEAAATAYAQAEFAPPRIITQARHRLNAGKGW